VKKRQCIKWILLPLYRLYKLLYLHSLGLHDGLLDLLSHPSLTLTPLLYLFPSFFCPLHRLYKLLYLHSLGLHDGLLDLLSHPSLTLAHRTPEAAAAPRLALLQSFTRGYQALLEHAFKTRFRSEFLELSAVRQYHGAELMDKLEKLAEVRGEIFWFHFVFRHITLQSRA
jgi:hypothetical protein